MDCALISLDLAGLSATMRRAMKKTLMLLLSVAPVVMAEDWFNDWVDDASVLAETVYSDWHHNLPESGFVPSFASFEMTSNMGERHGGSTLGWQKFGLCVPLADPRKSGGADWMFNASLNADVTFMDADGVFDLRKNELYNITLPVAAIVPRHNGDSIIAVLAPSLASDFVHSSHSFHLNFLFSYSVKHSETFSYSVGLGHSPDATVYGLMPVFSFDWQMTPEWSMRMSGFRWAVMRRMDDHLSLGAFMDGAGGSWAVNTRYGTRMLRVRSLVLGLTGEYDFSEPGETKRIATLSIGSTVATSARLCRYNRDLDCEEGHHYHPGLFVSGAVDFRF